jgi:hypothetical protein
VLEVEEDVDGPLGAAHVDVLAAEDGGEPGEARSAVAAVERIEEVAHARGPPHGAALHLGEAELDALDHRDEVGDVGVDSAHAPLPACVSRSELAVAHGRIERMKLPCEPTLEPRQT